MFLGKSFTLTPEGLQNTVLVYPNPASKETNVKIDFSQAIDCHFEDV